MDGLSSQKGTCPFSALPEASWQGSAAPQGGSLGEVTSAAAASGSRSDEALEGKACIQDPPSSGGQVGGSPLGRCIFPGASMNTAEPSLGTRAARYRRAGGHGGCTFRSRSSASCRSCCCWSRVLPHSASCSSATRLPTVRLSLSLVHTNFSFASSTSSVLAFWVSVRAKARGSRGHPVHCPFDKLSFWRYSSSNM